MRYSRIVRLVIRIILLVLTSTMSFVSFMGGYSAFLILSNEDNIEFDPDDFEDNIVYTLSQPSPNFDNLSIKQPFKFRNAGYFDLEDLEIEISINLIYSHINYTTPGVNTTREVEIFEKDKDFGTVIRGETLDDDLEGDYEDFVISNFPNITQIDIFSFTPYYEADVKIKAKYSLGLLEIEVEIEDLEVELLF
ncbi:MAG: hypothetical protein GF383_04330 [Candidatus Lokiarchaeota archaeon]|nr:hypothetical protein [Candidatus Lokiarchaeota archaeon]MBD3338987.1 hypothetical protein [Candidatus Lokiarchaeota archaeon]